MTVFKKVCLAAVIAAAAAGISTAAGAQYVYVESDYGGYSPRYYAAEPGYGYGYGYEDVVVVRRPAPAYYGYWSPSRDTACIQDRRDFAERTNFICR